MLRKDEKKKTDPAEEKKTAAEEENQQTPPDADTAGEGGENQDAGAAKDAKMPSLEELLAEPEIKAAFDAKVQEAVAAAQAAQAEEERIAALPPEDRAKEEADKREQTLAEREKALAARELKMEAADELTKEQLPHELADCFNYESAETYQQTKETVTKAFRAALQSALNERLRGKGAPKNQPDGAGVGSGKAKGKTFADIINENKSRR